jgi:hypothetical protein
MLRRRLISILSVLGLVVTSLIVAGTATPASGAEGTVRTDAYPTGEGYYLAARDGGMFTFGDAQFYGSTGDKKLNAPIVGMEATPFPEGYWLVANDGGIFTFGSAGFYGSTGNLKLNKPIVGMAAAPNGLGYWLVANDGGIFSFGSAKFFGSTGDVKLNSPIVGMAPTPSGNGYWLVATDGGIFTFGDANYFGSTGAIKLNKPIVGMESTASGNGYYLVASDGGMFTFGDAEFQGSAGDIKLNSPIVGMERSRSGKGYQLVATDGGIFNYGNSKFFGSTGNIKLNQPILGMAIRPAFGAVADAFVSDASQTSTWTGGADPALSLTKTNASGVAAGARIYGVEGLDVSQLGTIGYTLESGPCSATGPQLVLWYDANRDGTADGSKTFVCSGPSPGAKLFDPAANGVPGTAIVTAMDIWHGTSGTTALVDDIVINGLGLRITDSNVARTA